MRRVLKWFLRVLAGLILLGVLVVGYFWIFGFGKSTFTISKDTTYVLGPVDAEGYINYVEALDKIARQGVTPENNAYVLLWQAFGPVLDGVLISEDYFKRLGMSRPREKGQFLITFEQYRKDHQSEGNQNEPSVWGVYKSPWTASERPMAAAWLKANEAPLTLVLQASLRPRAYTPLLPVRTATPIAQSLLTLIEADEAAGQGASMLTARAMLRLGEGKLDAAREDLLASFRLSRLLSQGPKLFSVLKGGAAHSMACDAAYSWLADPRVTAADVLKFQTEVSLLPAASPLAERVELGERIMTLESFLLTARYGVNFIDKLNGAAGSGDYSEAWSHLLVQGVNWDPVLKVTNAHYDRLVAALREPDRNARMARLAAIEAAVRQETQTIPSSFFASGANRIRLSGAIVRQLLTSAISKVQQSADLSEQRHRNLQVAIALALYQRQNGQYPERLTDLTPQHIKELPTDLFTGKELAYRRTDQGYLLYSLGANGQDDGGSPRDESKGGDDIVVRMPPKK